MRIALLSDIHANLPALEAVLEDVDRENVDEVICLGDILGYNAHPKECLDLIRKRAGRILLGNHDWAVLHGATPGFNPLARAGVEFAQQALTDADRDFLKSLEPSAHLTQEGVAVDFYHASPKDPLWEYVYPQAAHVLLSYLDGIHGEENHARIVALGHTHLPMLVSTTPVAPDASSHDLLLSSREVVSGRAPIMLLNPGSVGQPRDGDARAAYAIVDTAHYEAHFHRVQYNVDAAADAIREAGLPGLLADRLYVGR